MKSTAIADEKKAQKKVQRRNGPRAVVKKGDRQGSPRQAVTRTVAWKPEEDEMIYAFGTAGRKFAELAKQIGTTVSACRVRYGVLKKKEYTPGRQPSQQQEARSSAESPVRRAASDSPPQPAAAAAAAADARAEGVEEPQNSQSSEEEEVVENDEAEKKEAE